MIQTLLTALADPTVRDLYLVFCSAIMVLPMIALAYWYHSNIHNTEGGRELMERQARSQALFHRRRGYEARLLAEGLSMARDINAGRYGIMARLMQNRVYWVVGFWLFANIIAFGILIWAEEFNRIAG